MRTLSQWPKSFDLWPCHNQTTLDTDQSHMTFDPDRNHMTSDNGYQPDHSQMTWPSSVIWPWTLSQPHNLWPWSQSNDPDHCHRALNIHSVAAPVNPPHPVSGENKAWRSWAGVPWGEMSSSQTLLFIEQSYEDGVISGPVAWCCCYL